MARMTPQDIVKNSREVRDSGLDWKKTYATMQGSVQTNEWRIFRTNNTLFWVHIDKPGVGHFYIFDSDKDNQFFSNVQEFIKAMKVAKYQALYVDLKTPKLFEKLQAAGEQVKYQPMATADGATVYRGVIV